MDRLQGHRREPRAARVRAHARTRAAEGHQQERIYQYHEEHTKENRFEFVVIASARARQLLRGALPAKPGRRR